MWFKNLQLYRLPRAWEMTPEALEERLSANLLQPCGSATPLTAGWIPPREGGPLVHAVNRQWLIALGVEQKLLPSFVVRQHVAERAQQIEETQGRRVGRRELRELADAVTQELLPRAFTRKRRTFCWIDPIDGWLVIDASSPAKADELIEILHKSVIDLPLKPLAVTQSPVSAMTGWIAGKNPPAGFTVDQDMELRSGENAVVRYARHPLDGEEIPGHIAAGKIVTRLAMTWNDRISFVLDDRLQVKRLAFLDILREETEGRADSEDEQFDLDFVLMTGELAHLLADLVAALGGEMAPAP